MLNLSKYSKNLYNRFFKKINKKSKKSFQPPREDLEYCKSFALLFMYDGLNYCGMQINKETKTIERDLLESLYNCGLISERVSKMPCLSYFRRASKTDRKVSSLGQVCSIKLDIRNDATVMFDKIQSALPHDIILLDLFRLINNFNVIHCNSRLYEFILPTFAIEGISLDNTEKNKYRLTNEKLVKFNHILQLFKGSHNFHNYSSDRDCLSRSSHRFIINIEASSPFLINEMEFISVAIHGQSFIIHQIRKMIAMSLALVSDNISYSLFEKSFLLRKMHMPTVPGNGLLLNRIIYNSYNKRTLNCGDSIKEINFQNYEKERQNFKENVIFRNIIQNEIEDNTMSTWIKAYIDRCHFPTYAYEPLSNLEDELFHGIFM